MRSTRIVTSFIKDNDKFLILKRSNKVKTMKGLWAGISGIIENNEEPLNRAKIEIFEELGISEDKIKFLKSASKMKVQLS
jgi:8-oxo-dGTP pyrophosphatase MutT (NUDIX family)